MTAKGKGFSTKVIHTAFLKKDQHNALQMPIYSNAAFEFETAEQMEQAFLGRQPDHTYSRVSNPTVENFEQRVKAITGAVNVIALSSGMAAISNLFVSIAYNGCNIVTSNKLFGNTFSFFRNTIFPFGVEIKFCDLTNYEEVERNVDGNTCAIFFETITNPQLEVVDITKLSGIARQKDIPLVADTTLTPPNIFRASEFEVNLEVVSSTKFMSGGATSIGGLIIDYGTYDWRKSKKLEPFAKRFGPFAFNVKVRKEVLRNLGACLSPYNAYLQSLGLETLQLRYDKAASNCLALAKYLNTIPAILKVHYPGLEDFKYFEISKRQFGDFPGAILTFNMASKEECFGFINRLKIIRRSTNIYDNKSLIIHPTSTIFCDYEKSVLDQMRIDDTLIRLSPGIEDLEDLKEDIRNALESSIFKV